MRRTSTFGRRKTRTADLGLWAVGGLTVLLFGGAAVGTVAAYQNETVQTCTVSDKDRTQKREGGSDARVYTEDCGTFQVADALFRGHFSSADTYSSIEPGGTYELTTIGFRVPFLSMFPNIVEAVPAE